MKRKDLIGDDIKKKEVILKSLANRRRLGILKFLKKERETPVTDIAEVLNLSIQATSKHLSLLKSAGLVDFRQVDKLFLYRLRSDYPDIVGSIVKDL